MSEFVFILGAGASKSAGAPLMSEFFDVAEDLLAKKRFGDDSVLIQKTFTCIDFLQKVYSKSFIDLNNLEQVFGLIELGYLLDLKFEEKNHSFEIYRKSIIRLIVRTIEEKGVFKTQITSGDYKQIIDFISLADKRKISFVTFNYDYFLELALIEKQYDFNYSLGRDGRINGFPIYKLHGSLNWAICKEKRSDNNDLTDETEIIIPIYNEKLLISPLISSANNDYKTHVSKSFKIGKELEMENNIYEVVNENPFIIPPTWNKMSNNKSLKNVWLNAALELRDAKYIIIVGYSLPETDSFFKYLLALGTLSETRIRKIIVINPDPKVEDLYKKIIGKGIQDRFAFYSENFSELIRILIDKEYILES